MHEEGVQPDNVTFVGLLSEPVAMQVWWTKGLHCDASMSTVYMISTKLEHYSSMVELLGCALQLFLQSSFLSLSFNLLLEIPIRISCIHTCLIGEHTWPASFSGSCSRTCLATHSPFSPLPWILQAAKHQAKHSRTFYIQFQYHIYISIFSFSKPGAKKV